jgi:hypothetical protein
MAKKPKPIRHPESAGCNLQSGEPHYGPAARAVFDHAAYTFQHFVEGDGYKWIALACLNEADVSPEVQRSVARLVDLDLQEKTPESCRDSGEHTWVVSNDRGHDNVHCARCMQCLGVDAMLRAYIQQHGGDMRRG